MKEGQLQELYCPACKEVFAIGFQVDDPICKCGQKAWDESDWFQNQNEAHAVGIGFDHPNIFKGTLHHQERLTFGLKGGGS